MTGTGKAYVNRGRKLQILEEIDDIGELVELHWGGRHCKCMACYVH
jgi:hypothetical protein